MYGREEGEIWEMEGERETDTDTSELGESW